MGRMGALLRNLVVGKAINLATWTRVVGSLRVCLNPGIISLVILLNLECQTACTYVATMFETATTLGSLIRRLIVVASPMWWAPDFDPWWRS